MKLTSSFELTAIDCDLCLKLGMLRTNRLSAAEVDISEKFVEQHHRSLLGGNLALAVCRDYRFTDFCR